MDSAVLLMRPGIEPLTREGSGESISPEESRPRPECRQPMESSRGTAELRSGGISQAGGLGAERGQRPLRGMRKHAGKAVRSRYFPS